VSSPFRQSSAYGTERGLILVSADPSILNVVMKVATSQAVIDSLMFEKFQKKMDSRSILVLVLIHRTDV
jgi:hypothetical protein